MSRQARQSHISATTLQRQIGTVLRRAAVEGEHLVVERDGFPVVVLISFADYKLFMQAQKQQRRQNSPEE